MKRSILMSLLVIGAVGAFTFGASTFAPFTADDKDSGDITAATVTIEVDGTGPSLDFELVASATDCDAILPGNACDDTVTVKNVSSVEVTITSITASESGPLEGCGPSANQLSTVLGTLTDVAADGTDTLAAGDSETFVVTTTFHAASNNTCQGLTGTVEVEVIAEA